MHLSIGIESHDSPENIKALGESLIKLSESFVQQSYSNEVSPPVLKEPAPVTPVVAEEVKEEPAPVSESVVVESESVEKEEPATPTVDSAGFPWDERIHASTKTTNKDGTWKLRKGADKALVEQIRAEFTGGGQQQPDPNSVGFTAQNANVDTSQQVAQSDVAQNTTAQDAAPVANNTPLNWPNVLQRVMNAKNAGNIDDAAITATLQSLGINGAFPLLANRSDLFESFVTTLGI